MESSPKFVAGNLCLDFHNTVSWNIDKPVEENRLESYEDVVTWAVHAGATDVMSADRLLGAARSDSHEADVAIKRVLDLRQVFHDVFAASGRGAQPSASRVEALNRWISALPMRLTAEGDRFVWDWTAQPTDLTSVIWPVVWSAAMLLHSDEFGRIGECEADDCGWLFVDHSRRHNRKWCQMEVCGNRAKAQRFYRRSQEKR